MSNARVRYDHAILRVVPRVERGEFVNVGVLMASVDGRFIEARIALDEARLRALDPALDLGGVRDALAGIVAVARGDADAGPIARLPARERFGWLAAPRSSVVQASQIHTGWSDDLPGCMERLMRTMVLPAAG